MPAKLSQRAEYAKLAELLTELREKAGMSQNGLATKLKRPHMNIWRFENTRQTPDLVELSDLAQALGTSLDEIVREWQRRCAQIGEVQS